MFETITPSLVITGFSNEINMYVGSLYYDIYSPHWVFIRAGLSKFLGRCNIGRLLYGEIGPSR